ncbi:MAG TPA: YHYH protein [Candidatus Saccharimonadales bacterium]|nr:YHYH protein [Candidatus Saccharimonadales bacterium]
MEQNNSNLPQTQVPEQKVSSTHPPQKKYLPLVFLVAIIFLFGIGIVAFSLKHPNTSITQQGQSATVSNPSSSQSAQAPVQNVTYTNAQLSALQASPKNITNLPVGDGHYQTTGPKKGYIYLCHVQQGGGGAQETGSWIQGNTWNLSAKPTVTGKVTWPVAQFSNTISGSNRVLTGNDLPVNTTTGVFPIRSTDTAYQYDRNPNSIEAHNFTLTLPLNPTAASTPNCMGGEVGVMLNGVPLFNGFDAENRDAAAHEIQDSCDGHPQEQDEYHYHSLSSCIKDINETTVIGFALDGYPITGPVLSNGNYLTTNDLDACHGMTSQITMDGKEVTTYHYVMTEDFPYSVSCFHGHPVQIQVIAMQQTSTQQSTMHGQQGTGQQSPSGGPQFHSQSQGSPPQPPQEAFTSCSGKSTGASCSFTAPNGTFSGTCKTPPNQTSVVCVPSNH